jgi:hypothetical protein
MTANVAELVNDLHAEAERGARALLARYVELVKQAAEHELKPVQASEAAMLAYEMELPADRFTRDLLVLQQQAALEAQIEADDREAGMSRAVAEGFKARLAELDRERRETVAAWQRMEGEAAQRVANRAELERRKREYPHLFADPATLTDGQWQALKH